MTHITAITACPSSMAHTYMAAESLGDAVKAKDWQVKIETQGPIGTENELTTEGVAAANMVILTKDIDIKFEECFAGKTIVRANISDAVKYVDTIMNKIDNHLSQSARSLKRAPSRPSPQHGVYHDESYPTPESQPVYPAARNLP